MFGEEEKDDYPTEVGKDGSLTLITVEPKHAGTYTFSVSNKVGSVEGCTKLVVRAEDEEYSRAPGVESNPITREKFGEYVSSFHAYNNTAFFGQFQTLPSGEEGHQTTVGKSSANKLLNRFRNITAYDDHRVVLKSISGGVDCAHDYINALSGNKPMAFDLNDLCSTTDTTIRQPPAFTILYLCI